MDFDIVAKMKVEELKVFLRLRNLKLTGKKEELVSRVFAAIENKVQPVKGAAEIELELKNDYESKLKFDNRTIPDPFKIPHGWRDEAEGMAFWPLLLYPDIFSYLMFYPAELGSKDLSDYKNCKAYSYYTSGWLKPLLYHDLTGSPYCIFKGQCKKSQNLNDPPHKLWLIIEKKPVTIRSCYCTCMAGMSQTCNHVAAAMYRIEAAVRMGLTNPACTSKANEWLPNHAGVATIKVKDMKLKELCKCMYFCKVYTQLIDVLNKS